MPKKPDNAGDYRAGWPGRNQRETGGAKAVAQAPTLRAFGQSVCVCGGGEGVCSDFINCISNLVIFCIVRISCVAGGHSTCLPIWSGLLWSVLAGFCYFWSALGGESWTGFGLELWAWTAANHAIGGALLDPALYSTARERHLLTGSVRFLQFLLLLLLAIFHFHLIFMIYLCADACWLFSYRTRIYAFRFGWSSDSGPGSIYPCHILFQACRLF